MDIPHIPRRTRPASQQRHTARPLRKTVGQATTRNHSQLPFSLYNNKAASPSCFLLALLHLSPTANYDLVMMCAECRRDLEDVVKADGSNLYLCGLCHEKERVHWMILLSPDMEEQALLARALRVIERADQSRPKDYGRPKQS